MDQGRGGGGGGGGVDWMGSRCDMLDRGDHKQRDEAKGAEERKRRVALDAREAEEMSRNSTPTR